MMLIRLRRQFSHRTGYSHCCASRFDPAIEFCPKASRFCLFLVLEKQNFMNDRNTELQAEIHEGASDAACNKFGMRRFALQNNAKRENGIEFPLRGDELDSQGDLERTGNPDKGNMRSRLEFVNFRGGGIH